MSTTTLERNPVPPVVAPPPRTSTLVIVAFGLVYVVWGSTYLAIRVGIESFPPLLLAGSRHLLTALILYPILRWKTGVRPTPAQWRMSFITGFLLLGVGNGGVCLAERTVPSGVTALRGACGISLNGDGDAVSCGRSFPVGCGNTLGRSQRAPLECDIGALLGGTGLFDCVRVHDWVYGLHLYFEEEHRNPRSDLCVCESGGG